ncbi:hypothetical protein AMECASPLE_038987 [Ameca splendens]|uniref:Uncharacterized protein n=1 Tax=Ameca splendens TaxID=208324 RepID=A0ABV0ZH24_9TELE
MLSMLEKGRQNDNKKLFARTSHRNKDGLSIVNNAKQHISRCSDLVIDMRLSPVVSFPLHCSHFNLKELPAELESRKKITSRLRRKNNRKCCQGNWVVFGNKDILFIIKFLQPFLQAERCTRHNSRFCCFSGPDLGFQSHFFSLHKMSQKLY